MKLNLIEKIIGSGIFTGYAPFASGTFGSLAAVIIYLIPGAENPTILLVLIAVFTVLGAQIGSKFESIYGKDPKECTIDEFVGTWITLLFLPKNLLYLAGAFIIWRIFDIMKPFPAYLAEKIKGGWGIMFDDIIAGIYSFIVVQIILYFIY